MTVTVFFTVSSVELLLAGSLLASIVWLSWHASAGLKAKLITAGPYRYTRNPQYVLLPALLKKTANFYVSFGAATAVMIGVYAVILVKLRKFGIHL